MTTTQEKLIKAAVKVFVNEGFSASTAMVTKEAGVSAGTLFIYYPTKNELITQIYLDLIKIFYSNGWTLEKAIADMTAEEYYDYHYRVYVKSARWCLSHWDEYRYIKLFEGTLMTDQFDLSKNEELIAIRKHMLSVFEVGIERGIFRNVPVEYLEQVQRGLLDVATNYMHEHEDTEEQYLDIFWRTIWVASTIE